MMSLDVQWHYFKLCSQLAEGTLTEQELLKMDPVDRLAAIRRMKGTQ